MNVWQVVKPASAEHPRAGQAGVVHAVDKKDPENVQVKWDIDGKVETVAVADLVAL